MKTERYFGLRFDFHASDDAEIGCRTEKEYIKNYIRQAKPDFIQCDCKGHPGYASYPTKVGTPAPHMAKDNLKIWCDAAKECGIPIYMHYSGVIDGVYVQAHPEDAALSKTDDSKGCDANANNCVSVFGNYADKLLIPQLKELIDQYDIDGVWVDGDCWAVMRDYSDNAKPCLMESMTEEEHNRVMREGYFQYLSHYVNELHAYKPGFQIASNWAYSSYIPEKPEINVDFLSGDFPSNNSAHVARYEGRCLCAQNKLWDLMAWGFEQNSRAEKPAVQLMQEAAMVLALGGGFQVYITQNRDGSPRKNAGNRLEDLSAFMQKRRQINFGKTPKAQTAVFYSATSRYHTSNIFNAAGSTNRLIGMLDCVLDAQYTANILLEYQLSSLSDYPVVVVPEWEDMGEASENALLAYAQNGGNLVLSGADVCQRFASLSGISTGNAKICRCALTAKDGNFVYLAEQEPVLRLAGGTGSLYKNEDLRDRFGDSYKTCAFGKGTITFIPFSLGANYFKQKSYMFSEYLRTLLEGLSAPWLEINKLGIDLTMQEDNGALLVNLINLLQGRHSLDTVVYNFIPEIPDITLIVHGAFRSVSMPLGEEFSYEILPDRTEIHLQRLSIHSVVRLERK